MPNHTITITLSSGTIHVSTVNPFQVRPGDKVSWDCNDGDYSVLFKNDRSPFSSGRKALAEDKGDATNFLQVRRLKQPEQQSPVNDPVNGATFSYGLAVLDPNTGAIVTLDPDLIIDDPGGGGGRKRAKKNKRAKKTGKKR